MQSDNVLKALVFDDEAILTLIDGTAMVKEGLRLHGLEKNAAAAFAEGLLFVAFMSAGLKSEKAAVSVAMKGGKIGNISVSGNGKLAIRGYIDYAGGEFASEAIFTGEEVLSVIRDDGYGAQPFVGTCACIKGDFDANFGEYYRMSEQLTTVFGTALRFSDSGELAFAGLAAIQLLPFSSERTKSALASESDLKICATEIESLGLEKVAARRFSAKDDRIVKECAEYKCNCSREYLAGVLVTLGKKELERIIIEDGAVKVHCHYCNKDYAFYKEDVESLFSK